MTEADFHIKQGNTRPALETQLIGQDGEVVDLNGAVVRFQMQKVGENTLTVDSGARILDKDNGVVAYKWEDGDTEETGTYMAEFQVDYNHGDTFELDEEFPNNDYIDVLIVESL